MKMNKKVSLLAIAFLAFQSINCSQDNFEQYKSLEWSSKTTQDYDYSKDEESVSVDRKHNQLLAPAQSAQYSAHPSGKGVIRTQVTFKADPDDKTQVIKVTETWTSRQPQTASQSQNSTIKSQDAVKKSQDGDNAQESDESSSSNDATVENDKKDDSYLSSLSSTRGKALALGTVALVGTLAYAGYSYLNTPTGDGSKGLEKTTKNSMAQKQTLTDLKDYAERSGMQYNNVLRQCRENKDEFEKFKSFIKNKYKSMYEDGLPFWWKEDFVFKFYAQQETIALMQKDPQRRVVEQEFRNVKRYANGDLMPGELGYVHFDVKVDTRLAGESDNDSDSSDGSDHGFDDWEPFEAYIDQQNQKILQAYPASASRSASSNLQPVRRKSLLFSGGGYRRINEDQTAEREAFFANLDEERELRRASWIRSER